MMKFIKKRKKDCLNQDRFIYKFKKPIDSKFIRFLKRYGDVTVFEDFPRPLIKMDIPKKFRLSAIKGDNYIDVFFKGLSISKFEDELRKYKV